MQCGGRVSSSSNLATELSSLLNRDNLCPWPTAYLLPPINPIFHLTAGLLYIYSSSMTTSGHQEATVLSLRAVYLGSDRCGWAVPWAEVVTKRGGAVEPEPQAGLLRSGGEAAPWAL